MTDHTELRKLAEATQLNCGWYDARSINQDIGNDEDAAFIAAANPATILSLLDRLEKAEKDAARLDWLDGCAHVATWVDGEPTKLVIDAASGDGFKGDTWRDAIDSAMEASK